MAAQYDFAAYAPDGRLDLVVEARATSRPSMGWAMAFHRNLLESGPLARGAWFLVATPTALYLWQPDDEADEVPVAQEGAEALFEPYFVRAGMTRTERIDPSVFDSVVQTWLADLTRSEEPAMGPVMTRLRQVLRGAHVTAAHAA